MAESMATPREDFPILSIFLARDKRAPVAALYRFARYGDDLADNPDRDAAARRADLAPLRWALSGLQREPHVDDLRTVSGGDARLLAHASDLLTAFERDQTVTRFDDWPALDHYYRHSAVPVGRFLADLYGEAPTLYPVTDTLSTALGLITNLRDVRADLVDLDRIYMTQRLLAEHGARVEDIYHGRMTAELRAAFDAHLTRGEQMLARALTQASAIAAPELFRHFHLAVACGRRLAGKLRARDFLTGKVRLSALDMALCLASAWAARR